MYFKDSYPSEYRTKLWAQTYPYKALILDIFISLIFQANFVWAE